MCQCSLPTHRDSHQKIYARPQTNLGNDDHEADGDDGDDDDDDDQKLRCHCRLQFNQS